MSLNISFPWIGLAMALALLVLLFTTDVLRSDRSVGRWHDLTWLSWVGVTAYLLHNVEEYGVDLYGQFHAFPASMCSVLGFHVFSQCPVPAAFFTLVNVPMFWFSAPIGAIMSSRHPLAGLAIYGVMAINVVAHVAGGIVTGSIYNPGWLTAVFLFLPLTVWMIYSQFVQGRLAWAALVFTFGLGVFLHMVLLGSVLPLVKGWVQTPVPAMLAQVINAVLFIVIPVVAERWHHGKLVQPRS